MTFSSNSNRSETAPKGVDQQQWSANPYANFDYRRTWWQKLWEGLGFRSKFDEYRDSMALNAAEYDAQLAEKVHNEQYDSPAAQASRYRLAGINPDINGDVSAGDSSPMEPDPNAPISPSYDNPMPILEGFANTVMAALTGGISLAKDGLSLFALKNDVDAGKLSNSQSIMDFALRSAREFVPSQLPSDPDWINRAVDMAYESGSSFMSRKQQKQFRRNLSAFYSSAPTQASQWKSWIDMMDSKIEGAAKRGSKFWDDGSDEVIMDAVRPLTEAMDKIRESKLDVQARQLSAEGSEADYNKEYFESADPSLAGEVENITNRRNKASASIDYILNDAMDAIVQNLKDRSESNKSGHGLAAAALLIFQVLRMTNFSHSSGSVGNVSTSKTSFGF